jgi:uncharacterized protein (TIGR02147 family)
MKSVLQYANYRKFLLDYYKEMRKKKPGEFSYRIFAKQIKMANASFLHNIMHGRRKPDIPTVLRIAEAIGLDGQETSYFANLVELNHASAANVKRFFLNEMKLVKTRGGVLVRKAKKR